MGKTALVTGASSGLGLELARLFAARRPRPGRWSRAAAITSRRWRRGWRPSTASPARVIAEDLADPIAPRRIFDELQERRIEVEFLVNNAGFGTNGPFAASDLGRELAMVQVNVDRR